MTHSHLPVQQLDDKTCPDWLLPQRSS